jgi:hypothetical protein
MTGNDAGGNASSAHTPMGSDVPPKSPISPAARKFAEYLARRMEPMIQHAATCATNQAPEGRAHAASQASRSGAETQISVGLKQRNNDAQQN